MFEQIPFSCETEVSKGEICRTRRRRHMIHSPTSIARMMAALSIASPMRVCEARESDRFEASADPGTGLVCDVRFCGDELEIEISGCVTVAEAATDDGWESDGSMEGDALLIGCDPACTGEAASSETG